MGDIWVDISGFAGGASHVSEERRQALWTFAIANRTVSFWGRYPDAVSTAELYARKQGVQSGAIALVDCLSPLHTTARNGN